MKAALLVALMGGLFGGSSDTRMVYVYYGAEHPKQVGSIRVGVSLTPGSSLVCEDGHQASFDVSGRIQDEMESSRRSGKGFKKDEVFAKSNKYLREFSVPRKASAIDVPKCAIVWSSGVFREIPAFSVDVRGAKLPLEVTKVVERVMREDNASDVQDYKAGFAAYDESQRRADRLRAAIEAAPEPSMPSSQPTPVFAEPAPVYVPRALPPMPSVSPPSAPGRTTTICRTLSNGTIVCN